MRFTPTLAVGCATTALTIMGCSPAPSGPEAGPPPAGADSNAGSNSTGGISTAGSLGTGGSGSTPAMGGGGSGVTAGQPSSGAGGVSAGSAGADAGSAGLGIGGAAGSAGVGMGVPGCPAGAFMCEGFEDYPTGAPGNGSGWKPVGTNGEVTVDTTRAMSGKNALHVTGTQKQCGGCGASIFKPLAVPAKTVFVRYMMYTVSYPASQGVHTRVITMGTSRENGYSLATYNGTAVEKVNAVLMRDTSTNLNAPAVKNRWVCWEFSVDATGGVGKVAPAIWLDGKQLSLSKAGSASHGGTTDSWDPIPYEMFYVGFWGWQADPVPADFWIDDLVVHSERLNCPAAN